MRTALEHDNLRAALLHFLATGCRAGSGALGQFWFFHGHVTEERDTVSRD